MKNYIVLAISILVLISSCKTTGLQGNSTNSLASKKLSKADEILAKAIEAHGGKRYETAHYAFVFRKKKYTFKNNKDSYHYTVSSTKDGQEIVDHLNNEGLSRTVDGKKVSLSEKEISRYTGTLNSVIYFATLPHKLQDPAVKKRYKGSTNIKGKKYEVLEISFNEENGGQDHEDIFHYWINQENNVIDYLAYNYQVNNGGVRFRTAYNTRNVDGILFQDYINYKATVGTPLGELPSLFEKDQLKQLSLIETEDVVNLSK